MHLIKMYICHLWDTLEMLKKKLDAYVFNWLLLISNI